MTEPLKLLIYIGQKVASRRALQLVEPLLRAGAARATLLATEGDEQQAQALLEETAALLGDLPVELRRQSGEIERVLVSEARRQQADLVVVATPGRARWRRWLRGSQARSLAQHVPASLLLVRGKPATSSLSHALIAAAGGRSIIDDALLAARLLAPLGASATVCHVLSQVPVTYGPRMSTDQLTAAFLESGTPEVANIRQAVEVLRAAGVKTELKIRVGVVVDEIVAELRGAYDLLALGAHQASTLIDRLLLEDLSSDLLLSSPVPVLLVRTQQYMESAG